LDHLSIPVAQSYARALLQLLVVICVLLSAVFHVFF